MKTEKIAVSLPSELAEDARQAVAEGRFRSVSAYVAHALAEQKQRDSIWGLLDELAAEHGEPGPEHYAWADRVLGVQQ